MKGAFQREESTPVIGGTALCARTVDSSSLRSSE